MRVGEFFRPGFWDILGAVLGVVGLSVAGTLAIKIAPSGEVLIAILIANVLMVVGGYSLKSYLFSKDFPFRAVEHERHLTFEIQPSSQGSCARVVATLDRKTAFSPRASNIRLFDRYQLIPAAASPGDPKTALANMGHTYSVRITKYGWKLSSYDLNSVQCRPRYSGDVPLTIEYDFPMGLRELGKRIEISEKLVLPNGFSEPTEFYEVEITEPARRSMFKFEFRKMKINAARVITKHGTKRSFPKEIAVHVAPNDPDTSIIQCNIKNAAVGTKLRFEWDWKGI